MPQKFVVAFDGGKIGVAVRKHSGFKFLSAHEDFAPLDGRTFPRARSLVGEVARYAQKIRRQPPDLRSTGLW